jgi:hypothetical protein
MIEWRFMIEYLLWIAIALSLVYWFDQDVLG